MLFQIFPGFGREEGRFGKKCFLGVLLACRVLASLIFSFLPFSGLFKDIYSWSVNQVGPIIETTNRLFGGTREGLKAEQGQGEE